MADAFARGVCLAVAASRSKKAKTKYIRGVRSISAKMASWVQKGAVNVQHQALLLQAEEAALLGKKDQATKHYRASIVSASRVGLVQDAGLANERLGDYLLNARGDKEGATFHMNEAIRCFSEWGAARKVDRIRSQYAKLWPLPESIPSQGGPAVENPPF